MKILFTTDLHGEIGKYDKLYEVAKKVKAEAVVIGGDILPKEGDILMQGAFITVYLDGFFQKLNEERIHCLCYMGNDDIMRFDPLFEETCARYPFVVNLAQRKFDLGGYEFIGMNWVVDYPFRLKDRCRMDTKDYVFQRQLGTGLLSDQQGWHVVEDWIGYARTLPTIEDELNRLVRPRKMRKAVYVIHMPPSGLGLDKCYRDGEVGSKAVNRFLAENQPLMSLHGHIHESPDITGVWKAKLGKTLCIQPGQHMHRLTYVEIDLTSKGVKASRVNY